MQVKTRCGIFTLVVIFEEFGNNRKKIYFSFSEELYTNSVCYQKNVGLC